MVSPTEFLRDVRSWLLDLDGCIWFGDELAPGAAELVEDLRDTGAAVGFLTNTSSTDAAGVAEKLRRLGISAAEEDVVTPMSVLLGHEAFRQRRPVLALTTGTIASLIAARGVEVVTEAPRAEVVVVGKDTELTYARLAEATQALVDGAELVALNLDPSVPAEGGRTIPGVGAIAAALATASGTEPQLVGKPSRAFFEHALEHFGMDRAHTVMVGDRSDVDVRGARAVGLKTILVGAPAHPLPDSDVPDGRIAGVDELRPLVRPR